MKHIFPILLVLAAVAACAFGVYYEGFRDCPYTLEELCSRPDDVIEQWEATWITDEIESADIRAQKDSDRYVLDINRHEVSLWSNSHVPELAPGRYKLRMKLSNECLGRLWSYENCWKLTRIDDPKENEARIKAFEEALAGMGEAIAKEEAKIVTEDELKADLATFQSKQEQRVGELLDQFQFKQKMEIADRIEKSTAFESLQWRVNIMEKGFQNMGRLLGEIDVRTRPVPMPMSDSGVAPPASPEPDPVSEAVFEADLEPIPTEAEPTVAE
jgi:hypothetical protein